MKLKIGKVVWKKKDGHVYIISKKGVFLLNREASKRWESLEKYPKVNEEDPFVNSLIREGLVEVDYD